MAQAVLTPIEDAMRASENEQEERATMSNLELYEFLRALREELMQAKLRDGVSEIDRAMTFHSSSASEFLGESRMALSAIRKLYGGNLSKDQLRRIDGVIDEINAAFRRVGS